MSSVHNRDEENDFIAVGVVEDLLVVKLSFKRIFSHDDDADGDDDNDPIESDADIVPISVARCCAVRFPTRLLDEHRRYLFNNGVVVVVTADVVVVSDTRRANSSNVHGSPISI